ncbi:hypothetical protein EJB05_47882, partial [Eragrostis curvula]
MAEALIFPLVRGVVGKAGDALVKRVTRMWGVDDDRDKLERRLAYVQSLLADAEVKSETNHAVRTWMKALKAAAYRADDVLDDFQYEALRLEAQSRGSMASKVLSCFNFQNKLVFRHKASKELKSVLDKIDELVEEMNKFGLLVREEVPQVLLHRQTHSALNESADIFGRDDDREVVVKLLLDQRDQRQVQVLPIIGMGGLGKTTLAKMVYNNPRVQKHFEMQMWCCVSENFEANAVVRSVIELATNETCDLRDNIELLRGRLQEVIGRKRFLLILDDVWNEEQHKWEEDLKPLLCSSIGGSGSMIVVTSQSRQVASIMGTLPPHELQILSADDSWELFSKKAFINKGVQEQTKLVSIGKRIVRKCKGLPLALKTMGGLMSSKQLVQEWEAIANINISDTSRGKDEVMSILKLSFTHLSSEMKQCFAFCAVFPKDYEMEKEKLIQLWMANGFIIKEETMDLTDKGEFVFNELAWRSFLQDVNVNQFASNDGFCEVVGCMMHDLMHDLARYVADGYSSAEELNREKESIKDVRHMLLSSNELEEIGRLLKGTSSLRTLLIPFFFSDTLLTPSKHKYLNGLKLVSLRALSRENSSSTIPRQLVNTTHLRYLDLSGSNFVRLPDSVCLLYNLQTLRLENSFLEYLPEGLATMRKLIHIYLSGCYDLKRMPPNLSLPNLRTLTNFVVHTRDGCGIEELKDMRHLGNSLELYNLGKVKSGSVVNLYEKKNLSGLRLSWGPFPGSSIFRVSNNEEQVLESLEPHHELKVFGLNGYSGLTIPKWMRDPQRFQCIMELEFYCCSRCKDLPIIWLSSSLEKLTLHRMKSLTTLCKSIDVEAAEDNSSLQIFPKLKILKLVYLPELERWAENSCGEPIGLVMFPQLETLSIIWCPKLGNLPHGPVLTYLHFDEESAGGSMSIALGSWPSLVHLIVGTRKVTSILPKDKKSQRSLENLQFLEVASDEFFATVFNSSQLQPGLRDHLTFVEYLEIQNCNSIVSWPSQELRCLPRLRYLQIMYRNKLEGKGSSLEEILPLPQLEKLQIVRCDCLLEIPKLPSSLVEIKIWDCRNFVALPDGMDGLTSLERLSIDSCQGIKKFPQGLLQRLPALKYLRLWGCFELQRCCMQGGEYFDLVSSIRERDIQAISIVTTFVVKAKSLKNRLASGCTASQRQRERQNTSEQPLQGTMET